MTASPIPAVSLSELTIAFPSRWLVRKVQGLVPSGLGHAITYWGTSTGLLHFHKEALAAGRSVAEQVRFHWRNLATLGVFHPDSCSSDPAVRIHRLAFNLDFPSKDFLYFDRSGFRYSKEWNARYSPDYRVDWRPVCRNGWWHLAKREEQESFLTWGRHPGTSGPGYRLQIRFSGTAAPLLGRQHLDADIPRLPERLVLPMAIRLSQVATPLTLRPNYDLLGLAEPWFTQLFAVAGWFQSGRHIKLRRRAGVSGGEL